MSGMDEQFYSCDCGRSFGWFVKGRDGRLIGFLLDPKSPRYETKRGENVGLALFTTNIDTPWFEEYKGMITYFRCRMCGKILKEKEEMDRLISFIERNWKDRMVRGNRRFKW